MVFLQSRGGTVVRPVQYEFHTCDTSHHVVRYPKLVALSLEYFLLPCLLLSFPFHFEHDSLSTGQPYKDVCTPLPAELDVSLLIRTFMSPTGLQRPDSGPRFKTSRAGPRFKTSRAGFPATLPATLPATSYTAGPAYTVLPAAVAPSSPHYPPRAVDSGHTPNALLLPC